MSYVVFKSRYTGTHYVVSVKKLKRVLIASLSDVASVSRLSDARVIDDGEHVGGDSRLIRIIDKLPIISWPSTLFYSGIGEADLNEHTNEELLEILLMEDM